jgi:PKD repeat protein
MKRFSVIFLIMLALLAFTVSSTPLTAKVKVGELVMEKSQSMHPYSGSGVVWEKTYTWPDAGYIALHFSEFDLAPGDYVEVSSPDGNIVYAYKDKGKWVKEKGDANAKQISSFWATHIPGDTAVVRLVSNNKKGGFGFVVDKWARGLDKNYIEAVMAGLDEEAEANFESICSVDDKEWAKCYEGTEMYNKARAVCRLLIGGTSACTGWLLGSEGHIVTNNHCISTQTDAGNTDYEFMAEGATCGTSCASWGACPGIVEASAGTLIKTNSALDYTLILLPTNITSTYGYMQLRDELPTIGERIYIPQHPSAWGKQLAVLSDTDGPYAKVYSTNEAPCSGGPGDIGYYADTAGGSSGSPVLAFDDNLVVALHHCAACPNRGVPIPSIISDMGGDLPANAVGATIPQPPVADFTADKTTVLVGTSTNFSDQSSHNPTSWSWSFPGGVPSTSTAQNPTVTYNTLGTYDVSLTATNALGSDSTTKVNYITVTDVPPYCASQGNTQADEYIGRVQIADLDNASGPSPYTDYTSLTANMTAGATVNVTLTPTYTGTIYTEYWKIWIDYNRDGDFEDAGEEVFSGSGTTPISGNFTVPSGLDVNTRMRVTMKYGSYATPCETFTYGEVEDYTANIVTGGNLPPTADFTFTTNDLTANFTDASSDSDGTITGWSWNFGDGNTSTAQNPSHTYASAGTYSVTLTVTDDGGATDPVSKDVTVTAPQTGVDMYVYDINQTITRAGKNYRSTAVVTIWDTNNAPVANATVFITWSGVVSGSISGITAADGTVSFTSANIKSTGPFTITVDNVTHATLPYNPSLNNKTTDSTSY